MPNTLELKPINDLLNLNFFVPSYQRGYRWTDKQVTALLDDIWDYDLQNSNDTFYCLQPIVVRERDGGRWDVIDGQQRLTTILLILHYLNENEFKNPKPIYEIDYETRKSSVDFLIELCDSDFQNKNIDFYHLGKCYSKIKKWFEIKSLKNNAINGDFYTKLINRTKIIWYEVNVENNNVTDIFTRLNIGKIQLTNAELIKALFLNKDNPFFQDKEKNVVRQLQLEIATEWDNIEKTLHNEEFWSFLYNGNNNYDTRIEYIFDLVQEKNIEKDEKYYTFYKYNDSIIRDDNIANHWQVIKNYFMRFEEWYADRDLYHLTGFLITTGKKILDIDEAAKSRTKSEFRDYLESEIKSAMSSIRLEDLNYEKDKKNISKTLLLFNIETLINKNANIRFSFKKFKAEEWNIEHIRSQTDKKINNEKERRDWVEDNLQYFTGEIDCEKQLASIKEMKEDDKQLALAQKLIKLKPENYATDFESIYKEIENLFMERTDEEYHPNHISNLALLNASINKSYKNAFFPIKRKIIIEKDSNGSFIPICTKNVFLKAYSRQLTEVMYWQKKDADDYFVAIQEKLKKYLQS